MSKSVIKKQQNNLQSMSFLTMDIPPVNIRFEIWGIHNVESWDFQNIYQENWILYWNLSPGQVIHVNGKTIHPGPDKILIFPPFTNFSGSMTQPFHQFYVHFHLVSPECSMKRELIQIDASFMEQKVLKLKTGNAVMKNIMLYSIVTKALSMIPKKYFLSPQRPGDRRIENVLLMLKKNPAKNFSIDELVDYAKISRKHFFRCFEAVVGETPKQFMLKNRLNYARNLLMQTEKSIDEIAEITGFTDRYHFSKVFKQIYEFSPVVYKKRLLQHGYMYDVINEFKKCKEGKKTEKSSMRTRH